MPENDIPQLTDGGELLASVDGIDYIAVQLVYSSHPDDEPVFYCRRDAWPLMPAARLATLIREIEELAQMARDASQEATNQAKRAATAEARVTELEAQLAAAQALPAAVAAAATGMPEAPPAEPVMHTCPDCDRQFVSLQALSTHRTRKHAAPDAHQGMQVLSQARQPQQFVEELGWQCAAKGCAGAHARSLHDPAFCTLHAQPAHNGHEIAA